MITVLAWVGAALALLPLFMVWRNLRIFDRPSRSPPPGTGVSILIPARDEALQIEAAVHAALASSGVGVEVVVLDDQSQDDTAAIVLRLAATDSRVRLVRGSPLPAGWAGKQRACYMLAQQARHPVLFFIDADVRVVPEAAAKAAARLLEDDRLGMISGFPREITVGWAEQLVIPWIQVLLLAYLPMHRMRRSTSPSYAAACGQWIIARREAYTAVGGHGAAAGSRHDGLSLPRTFRRAGWKTDVFDGTALAHCRMYDGFGQVWRGFGKSAGEGMATPGALPVWTVLLVGGHVLPWVVLATAVAGIRPDLIGAGAVGVGANLILRLLLARRCSQSRWSAVLHPVGALLVLAINGVGLCRHLAGRPSTWRGRSYVRTDVPPVASEGPQVPGRNPP